MCSKTCVDREEIWGGEESSSASDMEIRKSVPLPLAHSSLSFLRSVSLSCPPGTSDIFISSAHSGRTAMTQCPISSTPRGYHLSDRKCMDQRFRIVRPRTSLQSSARAGLSSQQSYSSPHTLRSWRDKSWWLPSSPRSPHTLPRRLYPSRRSWIWKEHTVRRASYGTVRRGRGGIVPVHIFPVDRGPLHGNGRRAGYHGNVVGAEDEAGLPQGTAQPVRYFWERVNIYTPHTTLHHFDTLTNENKSTRIWILEKSLRFSQCRTIEILTKQSQNQSELFCIECR